MQKQTMEESYNEYGEFDFVSLHGSDAMLLRNIEDNEVDEMEAQYEKQNAELYKLKW